MKRTAMILAFALLAGSIAAAQKAPVVINGVELGGHVTLDCKKIAKRLNLDGKQEKKNILSECANGNHEDLNSKVKNSVVVSISVVFSYRPNEPTEQDVLNTAKQKFGAPTQTINTPMHNALGAQWVDTAYGWVDIPNGTVVILQVLRNPAHSASVLEAMTLDEAKSKMTAEQNKPAAF